MKYQTKKKRREREKKSIPSLNPDFSKKKQGKNYRRKLGEQKLIQ